jgi:hypothetical protein
MDNATRVLAAQKLSMVKNLIGTLPARVVTHMTHTAFANRWTLLCLGYPEHWKDYSSLSISRTHFVENLIAANQFAVADQVCGRIPSSSQPLHDSRCSFVGLGLMSHAFSPLLSLPPNSSRSCISP